VLDATLNFCRKHCWFRYKICIQCILLTKVFKINPLFISIYRIQEQGAGVRFKDVEILAFIYSI
jgi:hypothetical protein